MAKPPAPKGGPEKIDAGPLGTLQRVVPKAPNWIGVLRPDLRHGAKPVSKGGAPRARGGRK